MITRAVARPVVLPVVRGPLDGRGGSSYPKGSILFYDADIDAFSEQTGGVHTFNHAVLSPQYQLGADGSYANVGAKPAVDTFDGEKWLRSCGAVTNIASALPSDSTFGFYGAVTRTVVPDGLRFVVTGLAVCMRAFTVTASTAYTLSWWVKNNGGTSYKQRVYNVNASTNIIAPTSYFSAINSNDFTRVDVTFITPEGCTSIYVYAALGETGDTSDFIIKDMVLLTATAYPVPYVPPGVTQPATNATTTNGSWFSLPDGSPLWQALTGQPLTLATRVRMGVGSGDWYTGDYQRYISCRGLYYDTLSFRPTTNNVIVRSFDGTNSPLIQNTGWEANTIVRVVVQVNTAGTQFRVGYMVEGTHTTIQWSTWATFDGSFNPSTLYRLMLGYNNPYPMWFNKITAWRKQVTDAEILEAMAA